MRKICFADHNYSVDDRIDEFACTLGEELLRPTRIYVRPVLKMLEHFSIAGIVHNTGGGFIDNIPRILPHQTGARLQTASWEVPPVFDFLQQEGDIPTQEMYRTFNMGIGMMLILRPQEADGLCHALGREGEKAAIIGEVVTAGDGAQVVFD